MMIVPAGVSIPGGEVSKFKGLDCLRNSMEKQDGWRAWGRGWTVEDNSQKWWGQRGMSSRSPEISGSCSEWQDPLEGFEWVPWCHLIYYYSYDCFLRFHNWSHLNSLETTKTWFLFMSFILLFSPSFSVFFPLFPYLVIPHPEFST